MSPSGEGTRDVIRVRVPPDEAQSVLFWEEPGTFYVLPSGPTARWLHTSLRQGGCEVARPGGATLACSAELLTDATDAARVRSRFREKYGPTVFDHYFGPRTKVVRLVVGGTIAPRAPADLLEMEFDAVAAGYLDAIGSNAIERYVKETTRTRLRTVFRSHDRLLEVGAGIGFETVPLLTLGHHIVAVDLSPKMLEGLTARAESAGVADRLACRPGRLSGLADALSEFGDGSFDGAYSTFGAFNLEENIGSAPAAFARVLRPGAPLVFTTLNRPGGLPVLWELTIGNRRGAVQRSRPALPAGTIRYPLTVYPRNPSWWDRALAPHFRRTRTLPVSVLAPPFESPRLVRWLGTAGGRRSRRWDEWLSERSLLAPLGEWSFLTYERVP
jgi:SAM-dependent methyltransferase